MRMLFRYVVRYKKTLAAALALALVNQFFSLLDPQIIRIIIDRYATSPGTHTENAFVTGVLLLLLGYVGVAFISRVAKNFQDYCVSLVTQKVGARLYGESIAHAFSLPYAVFEDQRSGELLQKLQKARTDAQTSITQFVNVIFLSSVVILLVVSYGFYVHWMIGALYAVLVPAFAYTTFGIGRRIKTIQSGVVRENAVLAGQTTETLRNVELVKSLGLELQEIKRLNGVNDAILQLELRKIRMIRMLGFIQGTLINLIRSLLLFAIFWLVFKGAITLGEFFSLFIYSFFVFSFLSELGPVSSQYHETRASMEALEGVRALKPETRPSTPKPFEKLEEIQLKRVSFSYGDRASPALRTVTHAIKAGETIAYAGPSGSGKSTLVKLILGLYGPESGSLLINGIPAEEIDIDAFRKRIGYVSQETQLFAGTVRENLLFANPDATDRECLEALAQSAALAILERGGKGLDTRIGEGGIKLSGGERQRLAIARALLRTPELLIFDEATSHLDSVSERAITETIKDIGRRRKNLTIIIVAHRLSTIRHAHRIYVLAKGRVTEQGTHAELLAKNGLYAALWREQASIEEPDRAGTAAVVS